MTQRIQEGALSAKKTPRAPARTELAPLGVERIIRPRARLVSNNDGDSYLVLVDWKDNNFGSDASQVKVRLRDYSCREGDDNAAEDPKGFGRMQGRVATATAKRLLKRAKEVLVEFKGKDSFDRDVCWVWIDGESLGQELVDRKVAVLGRFEG